MAPEIFGTPCLLQALLPLSYVVDFPGPLDLSVTSVKPYLSFSVHPLLPVVLLTKPYLLSLIVAHPLPNP